MSAGRQIRQASKQTIKIQQCGSNPPKGMARANSHSTWALPSQGGYRWQFADCGRRYATVRALAVGEGARVAGVGVPAQEHDCGSRLAAGGAEDAAGPVVDEVPASSTDSSATQGVGVDPPVVAMPSPDEAIAAMARSYAFLDQAQRHAVRGIMDLHLGTERRHELRMRLGNVRDLLY